MNNRDIKNTKKKGDDEKKQFELMDFPDELLFYFMEYLSALDLLALSLMNKKLLRLVEDDSFWKPILSRQFPQIMQLKLSEHYRRLDGMTFFQFYKRAAQEQYESFGLTQNLWTRVLGGKSKRHLFVAWIREGNLEQLKKHDLTFADLVKNAGTQSDLIMLVHSCIANGLYEMSQGEKILQEFYKLWQTTKFTTDDYNRTELHWEMMCLVPGVEDKIKVAKLDDKQLGMLLVFASFYGLIRCVDILLKKGADVNFFSSPKNPMFPRENIHYRVGQALSFFNSYIVLSMKK